MVKVLINMDVKDLSEALHFYGQAFDMRLGRRFGNDGIELFCGDTVLYLLVKEEGSKPFEESVETRRFSRHWTPVHLDFVVENLDEAIKKVKASGGIFKEGGRVRVAKWGKIVELSDPFGNGICLIEFLGRGYDEITSP